MQIYNDSSKVHTSKSELCVCGCVGGVRSTLCLLSIMSYSEHFQHIHTQLQFTGMYFATFILYFHNIFVFPNLTKYKIFFIIVYILYMSIFRICLYFSFHCYSSSTVHIHSTWKNFITSSTHALDENNLT